MGSRYNNTSLVSTLLFWANKSSLQRSPNYNLAVWRDHRSTGNFPFSEFRIDIEEAKMVHCPEIAGL